MPTLANKSIYLNDVSSWIHVFDVSSWIHVFDVSSWIHVFLFLARDKTSCCIFQLWDSRKKLPIMSFQNTYQVTAATLSDTAEQIISGGIDNDMKVINDMIMT